MRGVTRRMRRASIMVDYLEVNQMKDEYNFSNAEQGKFYAPVEDIQLPISG